MRLFIAAVALFSLCDLTVVAAQDAERIALEISEETTFFTEPVNEDGTIDYVAALNAHYGEGISNDDNAFVLMVQLFPERDLTDSPNVQAHWDLLFETLGIERDPEMPRFIHWFDYAGEQGVDGGRAEDIYFLASEEPWTQEQYPELADWLELNQPAVERLKEALSRPRYFCPLNSSARGVFHASTFMNHQLYNRRFARSLNIHAFLMIRKGDFDAAIEDICLLYQFSSVLSHDYTIMGKLVAISIKNLGEGAVECIASGGKLTHRQAMRLLDSRTELNDFVPIADAFNSHLRCELLDIILRSHLRHEPNGWGAFFEFDRGMEEDAARNLGNDLASLCRRPEFDVNRSLAKINAIFDGADSIAILPHGADRKVAFAELMQEIGGTLSHEDKIAIIELVMSLESSPHDNEWSNDQYTDLVTAYYFDILTPPIDVMQRSQDRSNSRRLVESTAIALLGYRDVHGELPESLAGLVPVYFEAVPVDPYAQAPLVYRVNDDGSAVVYSIGDNFVDDGGVDDYRDGDIAIRIGVPPVASE